MKPFDWGYFIKDEQGQIFNLRRADDQILVVRVEVDAKMTEIVYMHMSENRQLNFYGYAVTSDSRIFLLNYPDYRFIELELDNFDDQTMSFHLLSDPLYYLVRYDDSHTYRAALFSKQYQRLKTAEFQSSATVKKLLARNQTAPSFLET